MMIEVSPLISNAKRAVLTATFKDTGIVFIGNTVSALLGAVFFFVLAHRVGPSAFGVFSVVLAVATVTVDLFDIGINNAMVSFGSKTGQAGSALRYGLKRKAIFSLLALCVLLFGAPLAAGLLGKNELVMPLRIAAWYIPAKALFSFVKTGLQVRRQFLLDAFIEIVSAGLRLLTLLLLPKEVALLPAALWATSGALVLSAGFALPGVIKLMISRGQSLAQSEFSRYQRWMTVAFASTAIGSRLDVLFLTRLLSLEVVGWYQAAFRLFLPIQQLASSLSRVFAPRLAQFTSKADAKTYVGKSLMLVSVLALSIFVTIPLFPPLVPLFYGPSFAAAIPIAIALTFYFAIFLFSTPWWSVLLYYQANARTFALLSLVQIPLLLLLLPVLIISFGVLGAVLAITLTNAIEALLAARSARL